MVQTDTNKRIIAWQPPGGRQRAALGNCLVYSPGRRKSLSLFRFTGDIPYNPSYLTCIAL